MQTIESTDLIAPKDLAKELDVSVQTLSNWRSLRRYNLPFIKCGGAVRYRRADVDRFLASRTVAGIAELLSGSVA
jgi:hypothetical protein